MAFDDRTDFYKANYLSGGGKILTQDALDDQLLKTAGKLLSVLEGLRKSPLAPGIVVFGSMARKAYLPGDVDISIDTRATTASSKDLAYLLALGKKHYGYLDPFVIARSGTLFVRDAESISWIKARGTIKDGVAADILSDIQTKSRPLAEIDFKLDDSPGRYDPVAWEVERFIDRWERMPGMGWTPSVLEHWERQLRREADAHPYPEVQALLPTFDRNRTETLVLRR